MPNRLRADEDPAPCPVIPFGDPLEVSRESMRAFADALARLLVQYPAGDREQVLMGAYIDGDGELRTRHRQLRVL